MFNNVDALDFRASRIVSDIALMSRLHFSYSDLKKLSEKKRNTFLWYLSCEDRKIKQREIEAQMRGK